MKKILAFALLAMLLLTACASGKASEISSEENDILSGAKMLFEEGKYEEAILIYEAIIDIEPKNTSAYLGIADALCMQGEFEAAIEALERGIDCGADEEDLEGQIMIIKMKQPEAVSNKQLIDSGQVVRFSSGEGFVYEGWYYMPFPYETDDGTSSGSQTAIFKVSLEDNHLEMVPNTTNCYCLLGIYNDWIIYWDTNNNRVYKVRTDGTESSSIDITLDGLDSFYWRMNAIKFIQHGWICGLAKTEGGKWKLSGVRVDEAKRIENELVFLDEANQPLDVYDVQALSIGKDTVYLAALYSNDPVTKMPSSMFYRYNLADGKLELLNKLANWLNLNYLLDEENGQLYFMSYDHNIGTLNKVDIDNKLISTICSKEGMGFLLGCVGNRFYVVFGEEYGSNILRNDLIYSCNTDGSDMRLILQHESEYDLLTARNNSNYFFYIEDFCIYRIDTDGRRKLLFDGQQYDTLDLAVTDQHVFAITWKNGRIILHLVDIDGSGSVSIINMPN